MKFMYADEADPMVGIPFPQEFEWGRGELQPMVGDIAEKLLEDDPARAKVLAHLMANQEDLEEDDPVKWGWQLPMWQRVLDNWDKYKVHVVFGGNRSSKSTFAARLMVDLLQKIPEAELRCFHVSRERSVDDQQRLIWEALPRRIREKVPSVGPNHSIMYSQKNGFSDDKLILPPVGRARRGGQMKFNNYKQYLLDPQVFEGMKGHCFWCDEEVPAKLFETLLARLTDYRGRMVLTFTTLQGYSDLVGSVLFGARTLERRHSEYMGEDLPVMQESRNWKNCAIYYFWSEDNLFIPHDELFETYRGQPPAVKLARLFGLPSKSLDSRFPKFDTSVNVVEHGKIPHIAKPEHDVTRYQVVDPAGSKNWTAIWIAVDRRGDWYVYREWPDSTYGEWGLPHQNAHGRPVGKAGPAQKSLGYGYRNYADLFREMEDGEEIFERIMDPRMGRATIKAAEGDTDIISEMAHQDMFYRPAPGLEIDHGIQRINDLLSWDHTKVKTLENQPGLYVSDNCLNLIECMKEYSGCGRDEVWKDFIDCIRYGAVTPCEYVGDRAFMVSGGGTY